MEKAPEINLTDDTGHTHSLQEYKGKKVILYFYPEDDTPGCTTEACSFRDATHTFTDKGIVVLGVSRNTIASHQKFKTKYQLNFPLLYDQDGLVAKSYGVLKEKKIFGNNIIGIERTTFLINEDGMIEYVWHKVKPAIHVQQILDYLQTHGGGN